MNFELKSLNLVGATREKSDVLIVLVNATYKSEAGGVQGALGELISQASKRGDLDTKAGKLLHLYRPDGVVSPRVILAGIGQGSVREVRQTLSAVFAAVKNGSMQGDTAKRITAYFALQPSDETLHAAVLCIAETSYVYTTTKSKPEGRTLQKMVLALPQAIVLKPVFDQAVACVHGIELAKEWANRPGNYATPTLLAHTAKELAKLPSITCEVLLPRQVEKLGMGSFMAVAQGSAEPLRFIVLRYNGASKSEAPVVLVGKGITFDSGGISLKPGPEMDEMKFDMCGAASVLGVFKSLSEIKPKINVVGLIPSCENLPDGRALKPGDVVTSMSGQTIEILNTDAEGRLILCDALTYAERFKPRAVIDIATLTGACVIALGNVRSGLFSSDEGLAQSLKSAGEKSQDLCWRMPLDEDYAEGLKTNFADVANVAGRAGGAITAAKFLHRFASKYAWAHLDIAGTAWKSGAAKGATGRPVGLLVQFLMSEAIKSGDQKLKKKGI